MSSIKTKTTTSAEVLPLPTDEDGDFTISLSFFQRSVQLCEHYLRSQFHLQNFWTLSHVVTIIGILLYVFALASENDHLQHHSYALSVWGAIITYVIVLYRCNFEEQIDINEEKEVVTIKPTVMCVSELMKNENAQLLGYVCLWLFTDESLIKLVPFLIYSVINLSAYFIMELIPGSQFASAMTPLLNYFEIPLLITASHFDLFAMLHLTRETMKYHNGYPLIIYLAIWALRYENSEISRSSIKSIITTIDDVFLLSIVPTRIQSEYRLWRTYCTLMIPLKDAGYEHGMLVDDELDDDNDFLVVH